MENWQPTNPVERRFMSAYEDWLRFAQDKQARVMYWSVNDADLELVKTFFQSQKAQSSAVLHLTSSFDDIEQYSVSLVNEISEYYKKRQNQSEANGIRADWSSPHRTQGSAVHYLLATLDSLMKHHPDVFPGMVLILQPKTAQKSDGFERWLDSVLQAGLSTPWCSERVRLVQYGTDENPLPWLRKQRPVQVKLIRGRYRMEAVPRELVAQSGERGPSGEFRRLFVELSETLSRDDPKRLEVLRKQALDITATRQWHDQSAVVHLIAGAAYLKWKSVDEALTAYKAATQAGREALNSEHPAGKKLVVNGLFGEASVYLMRSDFRQAARCYDEAAQFAAADQDGLLTVEARRMQALCLEKLGLLEQAMDAGLRALAAGQWQDPAVRSNSNLQIVVEWMLEHTSFFAKHRKLRGETVAHLQGLYGEDWPERIKPLNPEAVSQLMISAQEGA